jgi:hypothetical protein
MYLRGHWLHGLSSVVKASVDGSLIQLSSDREYRDRLRAVFLFGAPGMGIDLEVEVLS